MDQLQELFSNLTVFQWVLIGLAGFLLWPYISSLFTEEKPKEDSPSVVLPVNEDHKDDVKVTDDYDLTSLVYKWETFTDACHDHELHEACKKLEEVFPMLVKKHK